MIDEEAVLETVGRIYEAALNPDRWPAVLTAIADLLGGTATTLSIHDPAGNRSEATAAIRMDGAYLESYRLHYHSVNIYTPPRVRNAVRGALLNSRSFIADAQVFRSEYYNDFLRPQNIFEALGCVVGRDSNLFSLFSTFRPPGDEPFGADEARVLGLLAPHLERAARIGMHCNGVSAGTAAMDFLPIGIVILAQTGVPVFCNVRATAIFLDDDGLRLSRKGVPECTSMMRTGSVQALLARLLRPARLPESHSADEVLASRPSGKRSYVVTGHRLISAAADMLPGASVILFIGDPEREAEVDEARLCRLFSLTPREATIASVLMGGGSLDDACRKLGVKRPTIRTHLQNLFQKLGVSRQSELVSALSRSTSNLPR